MTTANANVHDINETAAKAAPAGESMHWAKKTGICLAVVLAIVAVWFAVVYGGTALLAWVAGMALSATVNAVISFGVQAAAGVIVGAATWFGANKIASLFGK